MPTSDRAEVTAELKVSPQDALSATKEAAGETGLAHEAGPDAINLAGSKSEVLDALRKVLDAALNAGAKTVEVKVEAEDDAERFTTQREPKRERLVKFLKEPPPEMLETLKNMKAGGHKLKKRPDMIWYLLLQSFATWGNSRGWDGLIGNQDNYRKVSFENLDEFSSSVRLRIIEETLLDAKVYRAEAKSPLLDKNYVRVSDMGGLHSVKRQALACKGTEAKIAFMKQFDGIGDKYGRNVWMDIYDKDFRQSIAIDERIKKIASALGQSFKSSEYRTLECYFLDIAEEAGLDGWDLDRLFYHHEKAFLDLLKD